MPEWIDDGQVWTCEYKDSHRYWWSIEMWRRRRIDDDHMEWSYVVKNEDGFIHRDSLVHDDSVPPTIEGVARAFLGRMTSVAMGFATHAEFALRKAGEQ